MAIFFPFIRGAEIFESSTFVHNFPPNKLYPVKNEKRILSLLWPQGNSWHTKTLSELKPFQSFEVKEENVNPIIPASKSLPLLTLSTKPLAEELKFLPDKTLPLTSPAWRSTISISRNKATSSYQGEIMPIPDHATLISFSPFIQKNKYSKNYLYLLNIQESPSIKESTVKFTTASNPSNLFSEKKVKTNSSNLINLDFLPIDNNELLICYSRNFSAVPIFISFSDKDGSISLEHTHPPASLIIRGNRFKGQSSIKRNWFHLLK